MIIKSIFVPITPSTPSGRTGKDSPIPNCSFTKTFLSYLNT